MQICNSYFPPRDGRPFRQDNKVRAREPRLSDNLNFHSSLIDRYNTNWNSIHISYSYIDILCFVYRTRNCFLLPMFLRQRPMSFATHYCDLLYTIDISLCVFTTARRHWMYFSYALHINQKAGVSFEMSPQRGAPYGFIKAAPLHLNKFRGQECT